MVVVFIRSQFLEGRGGAFLPELANFDHRELDDRELGKRIGFGWIKCHNLSFILAPLPQSKWHIACRKLHTRTRARARTRARTRLLRPPGALPTAIGFTPASR